MNPTRRDCTVSRVRLICFDLKAVSNAGFWKLFKPYHRYIADNFIDRGERVIPSENLRCMGNYTMKILPHSGGDCCKGPIFSHVHNITHGIPHVVSIYIWCCRKCIPSTYKLEKIKHTDRKRKWIPRYNTMEKVIVYQFQKWQTSKLLNKI